MFCEDANDDLEIISSNEKQNSEPCNHVKEVFKHLESIHKAQNDGVNMYGEFKIDFKDAQHAADDGSYEDKKCNLQVKEIQESVVGGAKMNGNHCQTKGKGNESSDKKTRSYSRNEMVSLRFVNLEEQTTIWNQVYVGLGPILAQHLDQLVSKPPPQMKQGKGRKNFHLQPRARNKNSTIASPILSDACNQNRGYNFKEQISCEEFLQVKKDKEENPVPVPSEDHADGVDDYTIGEDDCNEDINSEDEHNSIQRPAFLVEGDPDFESGPPQDGLEYLRRVRWEAAQIPKVKVAKLDKSKLKHEQTIYMPEIPDIAKCPQNLLPSKQWEADFLVDFSELRLGLSLQNCEHVQLHVPAKVGSDPRVSVILGMDAVRRASMLRSQIRLLEPMTTLSRDVCAWIFGLCATVETPVDGDTGASLRCLLRKCAEMRSGKSRCDDEVVMLNILVTICGKYFGQLEK